MCSDNTGERCGRTIPTPLDEFRKLMKAAAHVCETSGWPDHLIALDLHALATATPEQLLGIVGKVDAELYSDINRVVYHVTPREGA